MLNPKKQVLSKTEVARYEVTFEGFPHLVSSGAQKNIASFGKIITQAWTDPESFDVAYFQRVVGRAILTRAVDAGIPAQRWYPGSIVRPLSSYALALMSSRMRSIGLRPDYDAIWRAQKAPPQFIAEAMRIAEAVLPLLMEIPEEQVRNRLVTEWVKREACWSRVEASAIKLETAFIASLVSDKPHASSPRLPNWKDRAGQLWRGGAWKRLHDWNKKECVLTEGEADLVEWAAIASSFSPKGFRLAKLQEAWNRATKKPFSCNPPMSIGSEWMQKALRVCLAVATLTPIQLHAQEIRCTQIFMNDSERRICGSEALLTFEKQMGELARRVELHQGSYKSDQRDFRSVLKKCKGNEECLTATYQNRITQLQAVVDQLPPPTSEERPS